jgi:hypothetical protein
VKTSMNNNAQALATKERMAGGFISLKRAARRPRKH